MKASSSNLLIPTLRDAPGDAVAVSHQLLVRAGMTRQLAAGSWSFLPLGFRTLQRVIGVIREEMEAIGAQELLLPLMQPVELWQRSGRYPIDAQFALKDRKGSDFVLAMTHEEAMTFHAASEIRSYRDLPQSWYQFALKERDEPRPQGGILRTREFIMKDSYSFDRDEAGLQASYDRHDIAYRRMFDRLGLEWHRVQSDTGMMGGTVAHEFMAPSPAGEDRIALCSACDYAANVEMATSRALTPEFGPSQAPAEVETPGIESIEELAAFLGVDPRTTSKAVLVVPEDDRGGVVLVLVRGDHRVHELKLRKALQSGYRPATADEIRAAFAADPGSIGPVGLRDGALREVIVDPVLTSGAYVAGANRTGFHLRGVEFGRDYTGRVQDVRFVEAGEGCPDCGAALHIEAAIEVANIFQLGTRYSEAYDASYLDENGKAQIIWMGSYGIGPARTMAAIVEQSHDGDGIIWPQSVAPYDVWITPIGEEAAAEADRIERDLQARGLSVLVDDRSLSPGVRFKDADLIGVPTRVTIGKRFVSDGTVELVDRAAKSRDDVPADAAVELAAEAVAARLPTTTYAPA